MALRHRNPTSALADAENLHRNPSKAQAAAKRPLLTRRPALDELSNRLNAQPKPEAKKEPPKKENVAPTAKSYSSRQLDTVSSEETSTDPLMVSEYLEDIFTYLRKVEVKFPIDEDFLEGHKSSPRMRSVLVNWLVQVHSNFGLCLETLHMCVSIIDRYLQKNKEVGRENLQLVGTSALLIACKYEEMYFPDLKDFEYICDDTFSRRQILQMEQSILMGLNCSFSKPLPIHFLRRFSKLASVRLEQHNLGKYLLELSLLDHAMSNIRPSLQAAAACCFSIAIMDDVVCIPKIWTPVLTQRTGCKYADFKYILVKFATILTNVETSKYKSIQNKYAESKYLKISAHPKLRGGMVQRMAKLTPKS